MWEWVLWHWWATMALGEITKIISFTTQSEARRTQHGAETVKFR